MTRQERDFWTTITSFIWWMNPDTPEEKDRARRQAIRLLRVGVVVAELKGAKEALKELDECQRRSS